MIKIPFDRCVIFTTLNFEQITDRLISAIYDPNSPLPSDATRSPKHQRYYGELRGFKFLATRIIGHKYLHLPGFLLPVVEGKLDGLYHGYEISLIVKVHTLTFILLLTWLGGLLTFIISSVLDSVLGDLKSSEYLTNVGISSLCYLMTIAYFYFVSWRTTRFFRNLFAQSFSGTTQIGVGMQPQLQPDRQLYPQRSSNDWIRDNLPSFPTTPDSRTTKMNGTMPNHHQIESDE